MKNMRDVMVNSVKRVRSIINLHIYLNNQLQIKNKHSYKYTVYVDKIVLRPKNGNGRLFLDKKTFALTDNNQTMNFT